MSFPGLSHDDNLFAQHFLRNIARIALAVDYDENGYRCLLPMAMQEPALMNGLLAVASSHYSRWQKTEDKVSRQYLKASVGALSKRFRTSELINTSTTLACILMLITFEVFSGSSRWVRHYQAMRGWIGSHGDCADLEPFLKTWVCLVDTQCGLNLGSAGTPELGDWLEEDSGHTQRDSAVDVLFGCSVHLPRLMRAASELYIAVNEGKISQSDAHARAEQLQERIRATELKENCEIFLGMLCQSPTRHYSAMLPLSDAESRRRLSAAAEIFRHCTHIYVFRTAYGPGVPLSDDMEHSLETSLELLPLVPDAIGPGANLGWCLVVIGSEIDEPDHRDYLRSRWAGLQLLGMENCQNGKRTAEEVWSHRDRVREGFAAPKTWQAIMQDLGEAQILI